MNLRGGLAGVAVISLLFLSSCYYDKEDKLYAAYIASQTCDTTNVTYSKTIEPVMAAQCATTGCHLPGGSGNGDFTTYAGVKAKVDNGSMLNRVTVLMNMPPTAPLSSCQINQLKKWIQSGAPNN